MTNTFTKVSIAALMAGTMLSPAVAEVSIEGNIGATTDYIWRGNTQASGDASFSGGLDVDFGNGVAVGTWVGSLGASDDIADDDLQDSANYELDIYASYSTEIGGLPLEVGYIAYLYPGVADSTADFADFYLSTEIAGIGLSYYMLASAEDDTVDADEGTYLSVDYDVALPSEMTMTLHYGMEDFSNSDSDEDTSLTISKGDMSYTISGDEGDDTRVIISWGQSF